MDEKTKEKLEFWLKLIITLASAFLAALGAKAMGVSETDSVCAGWLGSNAIRYILR